VPITSILLIIGGIVGLNGAGSDAHRRLTPAPA
jgi:hypothetical protein